MHGGLSTGPRTPEGLARSRRARWIHGRYSQEARRQRAAAVQWAMWAAQEREVERMTRRALRRVFGR